MDSKKPGPWFFKCAGCDRLKAAPNMVVCDWISSDDRSIYGGMACTDCWQQMPNELIVSHDVTWLLMARPV